LLVVAVHGTVALLPTEMKLVELLVQGEPAEAPVTHATLVMQQAVPALVVAQVVVVVLAL
jgi:hypothetical protein